MTQDLSSFLDAIDSRLLDYLDENRQLPGDLVRRLHRFAVALSEGSTTPRLVTDDWPDFYDLMAAFVVAYGSEELVDLYDQATFYGPIGERDDVQFTDADRVFLVTLAEELDGYTEALA